MISNKQTISKSSCNSFFYETSTSTKSLSTLGLNVRIVLHQTKVIIFQQICHARNISCGDEIKDLVIIEN